MTSAVEREATRQRILAAAARVLAGGESSSMAQIAAAAGIARGTLYRYFPTRDSLLSALEVAANEEAGRLLAEANLERVPVDEALARAARALVAVGLHFIVLLRERRPPEPAFAAPLVALVRRGVEEGELRSDVPVSILVEALLVIVGVCLRSAGDDMHAEDISATALRLFLEGARQ
jgi:TetR/AcrR family transcriptional regulator, mexCD-oprJ operon repressor